jgi:hypothetical protein
MQTAIALSLALTIAANRVLRGGDLGPVRPTSSVLKFCRTVTFAPPDRPKETEPGPHWKDIPAWLQDLKGWSRGARVHAMPGSGPLEDRVAASFAGGGAHWLVEIIGPKGSDLWEGFWDVTHPDDPEDRIWRVRYKQVAAGLTHGPTYREQEAVRRHLQLMLPEIEAFARSVKEERFADSFRKAVLLLDHPDPLSEVWHSDLADADDLPLPARQLLAAAQAAWVFGGMGSWNDLSFQGADGDRYTAFSNRLFSLLQEAAVVAANASIQPAAGARS